MLFIRSEHFLKIMEKSAREQGERNIRLLTILKKADKTKLGDDFKGKNEVIV